MKSSKLNKKNLTKALLNKSLTNLHAIKGGTRTSLVYNAPADGRTDLVYNAPVGTR